MNDTKQNVKDAFSGESQASCKYLAFARRAEEEGQKGVANLFRAAAAAEIVHARNHLSVLQEIKSTVDNLKAAYDGEHYEFAQMYPKFLVQSKQQKFGNATGSFHWANEVEKVHGTLYQEAIQIIESGQDFAEMYYHVCDRCGYTSKENAPEKCPVCGAKRDLFFRVG
jgi:rubrerythrin